MPLWVLKKYAYEGKAAYAMSDCLAEEGRIEGNIASNGNFNDMLQVAFRTGSRYFGVLPDSIPECRLMDTLRAHKISYFFVWSASDSGRRLPGCVESRLREAPGLRIYALGPPDPPTP
jgi:hypothetical protein